MIVVDKDIIYHYFFLIKNEYEFLSAYIISLIAIANNISEMEVTLVQAAPKRAFKEVQEQVLEMTDLNITKNTTSLEAHHSPTILRQTILGM